MPPQYGSQHMEFFYPRAVATPDEGDSPAVIGRVDSSRNDIGAIENAGGDRHLREKGYATICTNVWSDVPIIRAPARSSGRLHTDSA
jgi:hypothetical protein